MRKYVVYLEDANTGAKSEIDTITAEKDYTPEQYRLDCEANNCEWPEGEITFEPINEEE